MTTLAGIALFGLFAWYVIGNAAWQAENYRQRSPAWCCYSQYEECGGCP